MHRALSQLDNKCPTELRVRAGRRNHCSSHRTAAKHWLVIKIIGRAGHSSSLIMGFPAGR